MADLQTDIQTLNKMLTAVLRSQNNLHYIGGYVYGQTSNGDPYIVLYPEASYLRQKSCRVYPHAFKKLPPFIEIPDEDVWPAHTDGSPDKDKAQAKGIYRECPTFLITTYGGKETQMGREKRFGDVLWYPTSQTPVRGESRPKERPSGGTGRESDDARAKYVAWVYQRLADGVYGKAENVDKLIDLIVDGWQPDGGVQSRAMYAALIEYNSVRAAAGDPSSADAHRAALTAAVEKYGQKKVEGAAG